MLFDKRLITCKTKQNEEGFTHTIEYFKAASKFADVRYRIVSSIMGNRDLMIEIDSSLFMPHQRLNPKQYVDELQQKLTSYGIRYKIIRTKKEIQDAGIGKMFGMKSSKVDVVYRIMPYFENKQFTSECYQDLFSAIGHRICILKEVSDIEALLEAFYSGMIEDMDFNELFYAHFYCSEQLTQIQVMSRAIDEGQMTQLLERVVKA